MAAMAWLERIGSRLRAPSGEVSSEISGYCAYCPQPRWMTRGRRQVEGRGGLRRHHRDAIDGVMVPARAGGEVQAAGPGHPRLLHVAAGVHGGPVEVVEQARRRRIRLVLVRESSVAQAAHGPACVERAARVPHPRNRGVPDPLAVIAGAQRKVGGITVGKLLAHPGGVVYNQQFVGGSVAPAQVAEGVMVAPAHQRIDAQLLADGGAVEVGIAFEDVESDVVFGGEVVGEAALRVLHAEDQRGGGEGALEDVLQIALARAGQPRAALLLAQRTFRHDPRVGGAGGGAEGVGVAVAIARMDFERARAAVLEAHRVSAFVQLEFFHHVAVEGRAGAG